MLEIILGAILLAFGFLSIYWSIEENDFDDRRMSVVLLLGIICIIAGGWIIFSRISLWLILQKIAGIILALVGFFLVTGFPDVTDYQPEGMGKAGILIGLILLIIGIYLIFF